MQENCSWCDQQTPNLQTAKIAVETCSHNRAGFEAEITPLCKKCEHELREYETAWELLSH